ncbi:hypothetical protein [Micromonospora sp. NPDC093277]|uniref:hypothetical protein n=1 Tax=Micromonospora sp. NPDC093277 TaxID=3364291 RepID=UPI0037F72BB9
MRTRWFWCRTRALPMLPKREPGNNLPAWMREPTRVFPTLQPGRPGRLTPGQEWRGERGPLVTGEGACAAARGMR